MNIYIGKLNANDEFTIVFGAKANQDLDKINAYAAELNREAEDILDYQVRGDLFRVAYIPIRNGNGGG